MIGLIAIGLSLLLGIGMRVAGWSGALMVLLMWLAQFPPVHNPVIDEHTVYLLALVGLATAGLPSGSVFGLGAWWANLPLVKKYPWLR